MKVTDILNPMGTALDYTSAIANMIIAKKNRDAQIAENQANRDFYSEQNQITRKREDTAHQREVADLQAAGLSPLATFGGSPTSTPIANETEAPVIDTSAINDAMATASQRTIAQMDIEERKEQRLQDADENEKERIVKREQLYETKREFDETQKLTKTIEDNNLKLEIEKINAELKYQYDALEQTLEKDKKENYIKLAEGSEESYKTICQQIGTNLGQKEYTKYDEYLKALKNFNTNWQNFIQWCSQGDYRYPQDIINTETDSTKVGPASISTSSQFEKQETKKEIRLQKLWNEWKKSTGYAASNIEYPIFVIEKGEYEKKGSREEIKRVNYKNY